MYVLFSVCSTGAEGREDKRKMRAIIHESTLRLPQIVKFNIDRYDKNSSQSKLCFGNRDSTEKNKDKELLSV